ncbi:hypothetical protein MKZ38_009243 [Zalerion maritima]|uniref:Heterokaryon incompatibility domain-containing protein n=1 Tax=Zalerion maritima TaxID=339359 RepID=A0AAD5RUR2_9PEZI|nr:hypothetical protein MKZ38_009243 [Zalerion maritima]
MGEQPLDGQVGFWTSMAEYDGKKNPLGTECSCRKLLSSSGIREAAKYRGFVHTPLKSQEPIDLAKTNCPFCQACFAVWNSTLREHGTGKSELSIRVLKTDNSSCLKIQICSKMDVFVGTGQTLYLRCEKGPLNCMDGILPPYPDLGTEAARSSMKKHLEDCLSGHKGCPAGVKDPPPLPRRVLDVSPGACNDDNSCLLYERKGEENHEYACLSYCWGGFAVDQRSALTEDKWEKWSREGQIRIPLDGMDKCILEALDVVRTLGIRYLWVDSLCIKQKDTADEDIEIGRMSNTYKNASLVVVAAAGEDPKASMLRPLSFPPGRKICDVPVSTQGQRAIMSICAIAPDDDQGKEGKMMPLAHQRHEPRGKWHHPLQDRAWTLQECVLARRLLIFSYYGVFWNCQGNSTILHPVGPRADRPRFPKKVLPWDRRSALESLVGKPETTAIEVEAWLPLWFRLVENYTNRKMGDPRDSLKALQAVISEIEMLTDDEFVFGMSSKYIIWSLLWYERSTEFSRWSLDLSCRCPPTPSWSWVGRSCPVAMDLCEGFVAAAISISVPLRPSISGPWPLRIRGRITPAWTVGSCRDVNWLVDRDIYKAFPMKDSPFFILYMGHSRALSRSYRYQHMELGYRDPIHEFYLILERVDVNALDRFKKVGVRHECRGGEAGNFSRDWKVQDVYII